MNSISADIAKELDFILVSILAGNAMVFIYDLLRIFRRLKKHGTILIACEDICYWISCIFLIFAVFYRVTDGLIRGFAILSLTTGMMIYNHFVSSWLVKYAAGGISWCIQMLLRPVRAVVGFLHPHVDNSRRRILRLWKKTKKILKKLTKAIRIGLCKR